MRLLNILLLFFTISSSYADYKIELKDLSGNHQGVIQKTTEAEAQVEMDALVLRSSWMKCDWKTIEAGSVASKTVAEGKEYCHPVNFIVDAAEFDVNATEQAIEQAIEAKLRCGQETIKLISKLNVLKGLTNEQIKQVALSYSVIFSLLNAGAMDTALIEINNSTPDGTLITYDDKTKVVNFINTCN